MCIFNFFKRSNLNSKIETFKQTPGAVLLDVRTEEEYREKHIPGSINIPVDQLEIMSLSFDQQAVIFVYSFRGFRTRRATAILKRLGYKNVKNIGGIINYSGEIIVK